jgi:hypothetical protein
MRLYESEDQNEEESSVVNITLEDLESIRTDCKELIELGEAAKVLSRNPEFIKVIMECYFKREPTRLGELIASGRLPENQIPNVVTDLKAIGCLNNFLNALVEKGKLAKEHLDGCETAYNEYIEANK